MQAIIPVSGFDQVTNGILITRRELNDGHEPNEAICVGISEEGMDWLGKAEGCIEFAYDAPKGSAPDVRANWILQSGELAYLPKGMAEQIRANAAFNFGRAADDINDKRAAFSIFERIFPMLREEGCRWLGPGMLGSFVSWLCVYYSEQPQHLASDLDQLMPKFLMERDLLELPRHKLHESAKGWREEVKALPLETQIGMDYGAVDRLLHLKIDDKAIRWQVLRASLPLVRKMAAGWGKIVKEGGPTSYDADRIYITIEPLAAAKVA